MTSWPAVIVPQTLYVRPAFDGELVRASVLVPIVVPQASGAGERAGGARRVVRRPEQAVGQEVATAGHPARASREVAAVAHPDREPGRPLRAGHRDRPAGVEVGRSVGDDRVVGAERQRGRGDRAVRGHRGCDEQVGGSRGRARLRCRPDRGGEHQAEPGPAQPDPVARAAKRTCLPGHRLRLARHRGFLLFRRYASPGRRLRRHRAKGGQPGRPSLLGRCRPIRGSCPGWRGSRN